MTTEWKPQQPIVETLEALARGAAVILTPMNREKRERWGATDAEVERPLPGDELLPQVRWSSTHAITINARPEQVWPWIVQIGHGRGGFYSYEALENLFGCQIDNAETILAEHQNPKPGDLIRMHPSDNMPVFKVALVDKPHDFLLGNSPEYDEKLKSTIGVTWLFHLEPVSIESTRLIVRWRAYYDPDSFANKIFFGPLLVEQLAFVMETKMMEGIKGRVESTVLSDEAPHVEGFQLPLAP